MGAFALVLIVAATSFVAWREREIAFREANDHAQGAAFSLADHAARLFEVADLALHMTTLALGGQDWDEAERSKPLWTEMRTTAEALPYVSDLWLNDETGLLRVGTLTFPTAASSAIDRPAFVAARDGDKGLLIGDPVVGRLTRAPTFLIARRLSIGDDQFRGIVSATADLGYFTGYWRRLDLPNDEHVALVRPASDRLLVQYPDTAALQGTDPSLRPAVADRSVMGRYAPAPGRLSYYHEVGTLPLYITVSFSKGAVEAAWQQWLWSFLVFPLAALLAVATIMVLARRQARVEALASYEVQRARGQLASANQRLEQRVAERTAELRESNAEIQRFAYIVSHDLRAPLVNIMGFTSELQRLRDDVFPSTTVAAAGTAPAVVALSGAQDPTWRDPARRFRRGDRLHQDIDRQDGPFDQGHPLVGPPGATGLRPRAGRHGDADAIDRGRRGAPGAILRNDPSAIAALPPLTIDRIAVEQVFSNLIDNAVKYLQPGVAGRIEVTGDVVGRKAEFRVADNGRGIPPGDHDRVFELFRRSGPQTQPGDGIGLAHVRTLVRQLGGNISLESSVGRGSTFTVLLPLAPEG